MSVRRTQRAGSRKAARPDLSAGKAERVTVTFAEQFDSGLEREFWTQWLVPRQQSGHFQWVAYHPIRVVLGSQANYTPDFLAVTAVGGLEAYETKGFMRQHAAIRIRAAARRLPFVEFLVVTKRRKKDGGGFEIKPIKA
jgi:hypothetical protein